MSQKKQIDTFCQWHIPLILLIQNQKGFFITLFILIFSFSSFGQNNSKDSIQNQLLDEVQINTSKNTKDQSNKPLSGIDGYLESNQSINMIRRGSYAWEPFLNGMSSERSVITIDGMRIYGACTDKMDPVTSYVEITNLSKASIHNGQSGSFGGSSIAGSLDLVRRKGSFGEKKLGGSAFSGIETNNLHKIIGTGISYSHPKFFSDIDFTFRNAGNYKAGHNQEIQNSQFTKYNTSAIVGYKINEHSQIEASIIYDLATDIGYPALPMDVSLARALIGSLEYIRHHVSPMIGLWKTKIYYNDVKHVMDDSKRSDVPIRMDMPGWSKTSGFYSFVQGKYQRHFWKTTLSGHQNTSLANMTMYPSNTSNPPMFMLTWPDIKTNYVDLSLEDFFSVSNRLKLMLNTGIAFHNNKIDSELGLNSLKIFYPNLSNSKNRILKRFSGIVIYEINKFDFTLGAEYGERAPSVSEGYGFYLFNSFDKYDYIGNPEMKSESSGNLNGKINFKNSRFSAKVSASFFYIKDYIIGLPDTGIAPMTIVADGIRVYKQLSSAQLLNTALEMSYQIHKRWIWSAGLSYRKGKGAQIGNLPLIQPLTYSSEIRYTSKSFNIEAKITGADGNTAYNPYFGETFVKPYTLFDLAVSKNFQLKRQSLNIKAGVENIFDTYYTTFSDWNRIPRPGRNFYINLIWTW
ncbi:MAG: TonB-dependent receptor [Bacteroidetes bacterium]|nr:TonB-dependent receptor [Bacteroidota bacterium]